MKKILSCVLCVVMILSVLTLAGCGEKEGKETIVGTWKTTIEMGDMMAEVMGEEMGEYFSFDDFALTMTITFDKDGTYTTSVDEDAAKESFNDLKEAMAEGMEKYFEDMIEENELDMTLDELMAQLGMTMDELIESSLSDEMVDEMISELEGEGNYKAEDGKLYMSDDLDEEIDEDEYEEYELDGDKLTIEMDEENDMGISSLEFKRVK